ncbi:MAG: hypothetical protein FK733_07880 [Asgard group archaeon]|nr:hypothetical protein [Asgard group archaeon]
MKFADYKLEFFFISILITSVIGVIIWFILEYFSVNNSIEIAVISTIAIIMILISYLLHGKGLLPDPKMSSKTNFLEYNYTRKKIRMKGFTREKCIPFTLKKKIYQKYNRK